MSRLILSLLTFITLTTITATCPAGTQPTPIKDGIPTSQQAVTGYQYYVFNTSQSFSNNPLTIALTNFAEDVPDMWVSNQTSCPTRDTKGAIYRSGESDNLIRLLKTNNYLGYGNNQLWYITIYTTHITDYSIIAKIDTKTNLTEAYPQAGRVGQSQYEYYRVDLPLQSNTTKIRFYLLPIRGNAVFYVSPTVQQPSWRTPNTRSSTYSVAGQNELMWDVKNWGPITGTFYIAVYGLTDCRFQFTVHQLQNNALLVPGQSQMSFLNRNEWHYYMTRIENPACSLKVAVTSFTGDSDLFASKTVRRPSYVSPNYDRYSINGGRTNDSIVYTASETEAGHTYYVGVYGFSNTSYSIVSVVDCADDNSTDFIYLIDGQPSEGAIRANESAWYRISVPEHVDLTISITIVDNGDPDLYVSTLGAPHYSRVNEADRSSFQWSSENYGNDLLTIKHLRDENHDDPRFCPKAGQEFCDYYVQVFAYEGCVYSIVANTNKSITQLRNGIAVHEDMDAGDYEYFTIPVDLAGETLTVTVTDLGRGDPDLFINVANLSVPITPDIFPTLTNRATWSSRRIGSESISIPSTDKNYINPARYLISVHAWSATSFSIVATFNKTVLLSPGQPQGGSVQPGEMAYFEYNAFGANNEALSFLLTPTVGLANLFVSSDGKYPQATVSSTYFDYRTYSQTPQQIYVNHSSPASCHPENFGRCKYLLGIYGISACTFTVTVITSSNIRLLNGISQFGRQINYGWNYYEIYVPYTVVPFDLSLIVTPFGGDPQMYLTNSTTQERPTTARNSYQWYASRFNGGYIDIEGARPGTYILGILCSSNCTYTILSILQSDNPDPLSLTNLFNGQPQRGQLQKAHWRYYTYDHSDVKNLPIEAIYTLTANYGDPDLYLTMDGTFPTLSHYAKRSISSGTYRDVIHLDGKAINSSRHIIGIYSFSTASFSLVAQVTNTERPIATQLIDGDTVYVTNATTRTTKYYKIDNINGKSVNVRLTSYTARETPQVYISTTSSLPSSLDKQWIATKFPQLGDNIYGWVIDTTDPQFLPQGTYYIAVIATQYDIRVSLGDVRYLEDGEIEYGTTEVLQSEYYTFRTLNTSHQTLTITASPCSGTVFVYMDQNIQQPSHDHHNWGSETPGLTSPQVISVTDGTFTNAYFYIAVYGFSKADYEIRVETTNRAAVAPNVYHSPDSELLKIQSLDSKSINVTVTPAKSRTSATNLTYTLFYLPVTKGNSRGNAVLFTSCGVMQNEQVLNYTAVTADVNVQNVTFNVVGLQSDVDYYFSVAVTDPNLNDDITFYKPNSSPVQTAADPNTINTNTDTTSSSMSLKWLLGLGVPLFVLLAAFVIYLVIRNRRLTKELEIEMHDVPKGVLRRAVGRGATLDNDDEKHARTTKPYSNLLTDGERSDAQPADDPDAYHPPDYARQL